MPPKSYRSAGVDIDAGNELVQRIRHAVSRTHTPQVLGSLGGFASLFRMPDNYTEPVLVACTDGVGTKLKLALEHDSLHTIGTDLVAMCVNDLLTTGAKPLFFLDYYASARLDVERASQVIKGIAEACAETQCALVGGETAELPGLYSGQDFDMAGFCVGVAERSAITGSARVCDGDVLIGIPSSGAHANGYSLIRDILSTIKTKSDFIPHAGIKHTKQLIQLLLKPTLIYTKILQSLGSDSLHAIAHITGGGLVENLQRILPLGARADITHPIDAWPPLFHWIQRQGNVEEQEMRRVFNCGIGMVLCVAAKDSESVIHTLKGHLADTHKLGTVHIQDNTQSPQVVVDH